MRILAIPSILAVLSTATPARAADELSRFDIAEVRIGMTKARAIETLAKHFGVPRSKIQTLETKFSRGTYVSVVYDDGKTKCSAGFGENPGDNPLVQSVMYVIPDTPENRESMKGAAVQKYGKPSSTPGLDGYGVKWCADPESAGTNRTEGQQTCEGDEMISLMLNSRKVILSLGDVNRRQRAEQVRKDAVQKSLETKPKL